MTYHEGGDFTVMTVGIGGGDMQNRHRPTGEGHRHLRAGGRGQRLVAMDENGKIDRLEDTALKIAKMAGIYSQSGRHDERGGRPRRNFLRSSATRFSRSWSRARFRLRWKIYCLRRISSSRIGSTPSSFRVVCPVPLWLREARSRRPSRMHFGRGRSTRACQQTWRW